MQLHSELGERVAAEAAIRHRAVDDDGIHFVAGAAVRRNRNGSGESEPDEADDAARAAVEREVRAAAASLTPDVCAESLRELLPSPAARNAVDCALWDLRAKSTGVPVWKLAGMERPHPLVTAMTIVIDTPDAVEQRAREFRDCGLIKIKLGHGHEIECVEAVRRGAPNARLTVDANEAWSFRQLVEFAPAFARLGVAMIEQPLPAGRDDELVGFRSPVPLCADEACIDLSSLDRVKDRYQIVNIKLDKTGGFTDALLLAREARKLGLGVMTGCNLGTSLAMAPAFLIGQLSDFVDIDAPTLLARDREHGLEYELRTGEVHPPSPLLSGLTIL